MAKKQLQGMRVAIVAVDGFEQVELTEPKESLEKQGATVEVISLRSGKIQGMNHLVPGKRVHVDRTLDEADPATYDALMLPGGLANPDTLRQSEVALEFVRTFDRAGKPIAAICHAPWILISAGLASGRTLTSWEGIRDDVVNAGGVWQNESVVRDGMWVTSRHPGDLPAFNAAMIELFAERAPEPGEAAPMPEPKRESHVGRWLAGGAALVAAIVAIRRAAA